MKLIHVGKMQKHETCTYTIVGLQFFSIIENIFVTRFYSFFTGKGSRLITVKSRRNSMLTSEIMIANSDLFLQ